VFVSVTRSETKHLHLDAQYGIGFLGFPRRLNTAISRSRSLLVLVCDPDIVSADPSLKALVEICKTNGITNVLERFQFKFCNPLLQAIVMAGLNHLLHPPPQQPSTLLLRMESPRLKAHSMMLRK
jgi:hypothetical protein